jgi:ATP-dependent RNA helicase DDX51/DBP6
VSISHPATPLLPADILVATPGRLMAHLEGTPGFSLASLRFLVVDETDRLLRQAYQDWLPTVTAALHGRQHGDCSGGGLVGPAEPSPAGEPAAAAQGQAEPPALQQCDLQHQPGSQQQEPERGWQARRVVKFVVSATLTRDPSKINRLGLHCPRYIAMSAGRCRAWDWPGLGCQSVAYHPVWFAASGRVWHACVQSAARHLACGNGTSSSRLSAGHTTRDGET